MKTVSLIASVSLALGGATGYLIGSSGSKDPSDAQLESSEASSLRSGRGVTVTRAVSREARLNEVMSRPGQTDRLQGMLDLYDSLRPEDFESEAERVRNLPGAERFIGAFLLYSKWGEVDPMGAMAHVEKLGFIGMMVRPIVLQGWAGTDPQSAVKYYEDNKTMFGMMGRFGGGASPAATIAGEWARQDPDSALNWAKGLEGSERLAAGASIFSNLAMTDPQRAGTMAAGLEDPEERAGAIAEVARTWGGQDWESTQAWINGLPSDQQDAARAEAIRGLAQSDPMFAAEQVTALPDGESKQGAVREVAQSMAMENPEKAADWLMENGDPSTQAGAIDDVMRSWVASDENQARQFIDQQAQGEVRDQATASFVQNSSGDPVARLELASTIQDENLQRRTTMRTAGQWMSQDPDSAKQWIESTNQLDERAKERLQNGRGFFGRGRGRGR